MMYDESDDDISDTGSGQHPSPAFAQDTLKKRKVRSKGNRKIKKGKKQVEPSRIYDDDYDRSCDPYLESSEGEEEEEDEDDEDEEEEEEEEEEGKPQYFSVQEIGKVVVTPFYTYSVKDDKGLLKSYIPGVLNRKYFSNQSVIGVRHLHISPYQSGYKITVRGFNYNRIVVDDGLLLAGSTITSTSRFLVSSVELSVEEGNMLIRLYLHKTRSINRHLKLVLKVFYCFLLYLAYKIVLVLQSR